MNLILEEEVKLPCDFSLEDVATQVIEMALDTEDFPYDVEVSLTITNDEAIQEINKDFREIDRSTDVLSFPLQNFTGAGSYDIIDETCVSENGEVLLGDIVISVEHVLAQAEAYGHSVKREYAFLIAHSMLHLLGYDHMEEAEAETMFSKQDLILDKLHITREEN